MDSPPNTKDGNLPAISAASPSDRAATIAAMGGRVLLDTQDGPKLRDLPECPPEVHPQTNLLYTCLTDIEANMVEGRHRSIRRACRETGWSRDQYYAAVKSSAVVKIRLEQWAIERQAATALIQDELLDIVANQVQIAKTPGPHATKAFNSLVSFLENSIKADEELVAASEGDQPQASPARLIAEQLIKQTARREQFKVTVESSPADPLDRAIDATPL